jgi:hypothetical protein
VLKFCELEFDLFPAIRSRAKCGRHCSDRQLMKNLSFMAFEQGSFVGAMPSVNGALKQLEPSADSFDLGGHELKVLQRFSTVVALRFK